MQAADVEQAELAWDRAYRQMRADHGYPTPERTADVVDMGVRRFEYLRRGDPGGSWVAVDGSEVVGVAQSHVRGPTWVLAVLGVVPEHQERGTGRMLLDAAVRYGAPAPRGVVFASPDARATHRYVTAGFEMHPCGAAYGALRTAVAEPEGIHNGSGADVDVLGAVDRAVRGSERPDDLRFMVASGSDLLVDDDNRGYAVVRGGRLSTLAALDDDTAIRLMTMAMARCPSGQPFDVSWLHARQQWAFRTLAAAGVSLSTHESIMVRGPWLPALPYLPNGVFG